MVSANNGREISWLTSNLARGVTAPLLRRSLKKVSIASTSLAAGSLADRRSASTIVRFCGLSGLSGLAVGDDVGNTEGALLVVGPVLKEE